MRNPVIRKGESGGFKWKFRRFWLDISTLSGNFKARVVAAEHPYGYLYAGDDEQTKRFSEILYSICMLITTDQKFVDDIERAVLEYEERLAAVFQEEESEEIAIEEVKAVQEYVDMDKKEKRRYDRDVNGRFKKVLKEHEQKKKN